MTDLAPILKTWLAVSPAASRIAAALYDARGEVVTYAALIDVSGQTRKGVNLSVKNLRAAMEPKSIALAFMVGLRMTPGGMADCNAALADAAQRERAA